MKLLLKEINGLSVVVKGENDARIQIIGLLESRTLDYKNVVFLSCNEEFLPSKSNSIDLFPEDLKKFFGIPSVYEREALSAYYFFRNFHYAKNIDLLFVKGDDKGLTYNEPSRYIRQIEKELGGKKNFKINHHHIKMDITQKIHQVKSSEKTKEVLTKWMEEGISASSIQKYCTCPLDFYFKYVLNIKEKKKINQHLEPSDWGIGIHKTLENLFYKGRRIDILEIKKIKTELSQCMEDTFDQIFVDKRFINGKNALIYHHYKKCIENLLDKEIPEINLFGGYKILETENKLISNNLTSLEKSTNKIKFLGYVDRIDSTDQGIRLIDYKTGMVLQNDLNISDFSQLTKKHKALQLFFYALLWNDSNIKTENLTCQIVSLKNTYQPKLNLTFKKKDRIDKEMVSNYSNWLVNFVDEIKNTESFKHKIDSSYCEIC
jgi:glutaredoxin-related protein